MTTYVTNPYGPGTGVWLKSDLERLERKRTRRRLLSRVPYLAWRAVRFLAHVLWEALKLYLFVLLRLVSLCLRAI